MMNRTMLARRWTPALISMQRRTRSWTKRVKRSKRIRQSPSTHRPPMGKRMNRVRHVRRGIAFEKPSIALTKPYARFLLSATAEIDADSYNLVTCYCGKPYANRPMIECSQCLTWLHLSCAKVKRRHIPDIFICVKCVKQNDQNAKETTKNTDHNEPNENSQTKGSSPQARSDKMENNILQPLNGSFETGANKLENLKTSTGVAVKYK